MRTVAISWDIEGGRFVGLGSHASHPISINAPRAHDETRGATGFSATELLLAGAGACSAWDVVEILHKRRHDISALDVSVEGHQQDDPPWAYQRIALHFRVAGEGLTVPVISRVIRLSVNRYCSVVQTLVGVAAIEATVELIAPDGTTTGRRHIELAIPAAPLPPALEPISDEDEEAQPKSATPSGQ